MNNLSRFFTATFAALSLTTVFAADVIDVKVLATDGFGGDVSSVLSMCQTRAGAVYDAVTISRDVAALKASGEYETIDVDANRTPDGVEVTFSVRRKARFQAPLVVKGAEFFSESKIMTESGLKDGNLYGEGDLAEAAGKVRAAYNKKSFPMAKVTPIVEPIAGGGNSATVTLLVDEGPRMKIDSFVFEGATAVERADLRKAIGDFSWWDPRCWFGEAPTSAAKLAEAKQQIAEVYRERGYLDVEVSDVRFEPCGKDRVFAVFTVTEGPLYTVASTSVTGLTRYPEESVAAKSDLPEVGSVAGSKALDEAARRVQIAVGSGDLGLADSQVDVKWSPSESDPTKLDIVFAVTEGVPVVINEVRIVGNDYTMDKVIRREISLGPGDRMLEDHADRSKRRLENLDYFSRVSYELQDAHRGKNAAGEEYRDLVYKVTEKNTGNFMVGVGASSVDSVYVSAEVSQSNFDIFAPGKLFRGAGQKGRLYAQVGPRIQTYEASVTEPHLFDRLLDLTVEGYRRQRWYDEYDIIRSGGSVAVSYPVKFWPTWNPFGRFGVRWSAEFIEFDDVDKDMLYYKGRLTSLREEDRKYGDAFEAPVRIFWSHDTRNSFRMPTEGSRTSIYCDISAIGDNDYYKFGISHRNYWNVWKRYNHVLMLALRAETIDGISDDVPIYNRLFLGGPKSIRGIEYRHVSPFARKATKDGDPRNSYMPWGGQTLVCANLEYTVPIVNMFRVATFTDVGSVSADEWDLSDDFAWTVGLGFRIDIPMFPIRLDFATPIEKPSHARKEVFSFSVGYDF